MSTFLVILLGGLLVRLDGWGGTPRWLSTWVLGILSGLAVSLVTSDVYGLFAAIAFIAWRLPGFNQWERWLNMFWRGMWPTAITFPVLSYIATGNTWWGLLAIPMGFAEALAYSGAYKWLPGRVKEWVVHVVAEITSGFFFTAFIMLIWSAQWM